MHIAYAVAFFLFIGLCETLRHGVFGLTSLEITGITYGTLAVLTVLFLRSDLIYVLRRPRHALYGNPRLIWTWGRTALGIVLGPLLWAVPVLYGLAVSQITLLPISPDPLIQFVVLQVGLVALAEEAFFRESAVRAFRSNIAAIYLVSVLAYFIFHIPQGVPDALIAAGAGIYYVTLRLIGTNILAVALVHGATNVMLGDVIALGNTAGDTWRYAGYFFAACALISFAVLQLGATKPNRRQYRYA